MHLFDTHCHLQHDSLSVRLDDVVRRAEQKHVCHMVCCGTCPSDWERVAEISDIYPRVIPAFGIHPWGVEEDGAQSRDRLRQLLAEYPKSCVGEIGLDFAVRPRRDLVQRELFLAQVVLAKEMDRPLSVHCRRAWGVLLEVLDAVGGVPRGAVIHSFSGSVEVIAQLVGHGCYFSFSGAITNPAFARAKKLVQAVPPDRLLIETDAPDMLPVALRHSESENEPANLILVAEQVAQFLEISPEKVAAVTTANAARLFL